MIIGNSFDANSFHIYRKRDEPYTVIKVDWVNQESLDSFLRDEEDVEDYVLIEEKSIFPYIEDGWHEGLRFDNKEVNYLLECDYCRDIFTLSWEKRKGRVSRYLGHFYERNWSKNENLENSDLYKDNCEECLNRKKKETHMIKHGFFHPSQTPEHRERMLDVFHKHNLVPTSRGQRYIAKIFDAKLNVPVEDYFVDMILDDKVVIEYDGGGHNLLVLTGDMSQEEFDKRERIRSQVLFDKGYKLLRFISPSELFPEDEEYTKKIICEAIAEMYLEDKQEIHITMNSRVNDELHGKLLPIKRILEKSEWGEELL